MNVRPENIKLLEENISSKVLTSVLVTFFFLTPETKGTKAKANIWVLSTLKIFYIAKETINNMKRHPTEWDNIFAKVYLKRK